MSRDAQQPDRLPHWWDSQCREIERLRAREIEPRPPHPLAAMAAKCQRCDELEIENAELRQELELLRAHRDVHREVEPLPLNVKT